MGLNVEEESSLHTDFGAEGHETKNLFGEQIPATSSVVSCGGIGEVTAAGGQRLRHMSIAVPEEKIDAFRVLYCKRSLKKRKSYAYVGRRVYKTFLRVARAFCTTALTTIISPLLQRWDSRRFKSAVDAS